MNECICQKAKSFGEALRLLLGSSKLPDQANGLRLTCLDQFEQQLFCQAFGLHCSNLFALAPEACGDSEDLSGHPVGAFVCLTIDLAGDRVAG